MQILPSTARMLGFYGTNRELAEPMTNIRYGVDYLTGAWQLAAGDICTTVMKYRAGHGETRFSYKSVAYCQRVRAVLAGQGYPVRGEVPKPTFGSPAGTLVAARGTTGRAGPRRARSKIDWAGYDRRIKAIEFRMATSSLIIMR